MPKSKHRKKAKAAPVKKALHPVTKNPYTFADYNGEEYTLSTAQKFRITQKMMPMGPVSDERLNLAETYTRCLFGMDAKPIRFGENPPTDDRIISCLKQVGLGWTNDTHGLIIDDVDMTADLRVVFDQLDKLVKIRDEYEDEPEIDRDAIRAVGVRLNEIGGMDAMRDAADILRVMVGSKAERLGWAWDGIGEWRW